MDYDHFRSVRPIFRSFGGEFKGEPWQARPRGAAGAREESACEARTSGTHTRMNPAPRFSVARRGRYEALWWHADEAMPTTGHCPDHSDSSVVNARPAMPSACSRPVLKGPSPVRGRIPTPSGCLMMNGMIWRRRRESKPHPGPTTNRRIEVGSGEDVISPKIPDPGRSDWGMVKSHFVSGQRRRRTAVHLLVSDAALLNGCISTHSIALSSSDL